MIFFLDFRDWSLSDSIWLEVLPLKADSHDIIFWSFFSFLKLLSPVKMVLSMTLYFQVVNNTRSAENSFLYNSKVILLTGDPSQNERWKQFIMADSFNGLRYYRVHLMQLHHIHVSFFCLRCVMAFKMSAWCVIGAPPFPPPSPLGLLCQSVPT